MEKVHNIQFHVLNIILCEFVMILNCPVCLLPQRLLLKRLLNDDCGEAY